MLTDIVGYTYRADQFCPNCTIEELKAEFRAQLYDGGSSAEGVLDAIADAEGIDREIEWSFDSDDFPKVIFESQLDCGNSEFTTEHERCGACGVNLCGRE